MQRGTSINFSFYSDNGKLNQWYKDTEMEMFSRRLPYQQRLYDNIKCLY